MYPQYPFSSGLVLFLMIHLVILVIPSVLASSFCMWGEESGVVLSAGCRYTVDFYSGIVWCFFLNNSLYLTWLLTVTDY